MPITLSANVAAMIKDPVIAAASKQSRHWSSDGDINIDDADLTDELLLEIEKQAKKLADHSTRRQAAAIYGARNNNHQNIVKLGNVPEMLLAYMRDDLIKGWLWTRDEDGYLYPWLLTDVHYYEGQGREDRPYVSFRLFANGAQKSSTYGRKENKLAPVSRSFTLHSDDVRNKPLPEILLKKGLWKETADLHEEYERQTEIYHETLTKGFAKQFAFDGIWHSSSWREADTRRKTKVVHDIQPGDIPPFIFNTKSMVFGAKMSKRQSKVALEADADDYGVGQVPIQPMLYVFDLAAHDFNWTHIQSVKPYEFDKTMGDKLVLPKSQRELLDILTTDIKVFAGDIVDGKAAGNVILCVGEPGLGKTLSAEIYAEITERALYKIHSGNLGTEPDVIRKKLEEAMRRCKRWDAVLLLDEADVFIRERGNDIQQNAIVAEWLQVLEYFDGLLFMTSNREQTIDDAIISRCAAIIRYEYPEGEDAERVWQVLAELNSLKITPKLQKDLAKHFTKIAPREVKMLLRLALRVSKHREIPLTIDVFRQCAIFRGIHFEE